jgi:hypothetical protein
VGQPALLLKVEALRVNCRELDGAQTLRLEGLSFALRAG